MSSLESGTAANVVDNSIFIPSISTTPELNPWYNIRLSESGVIKSVAFFTNPHYANRYASTSIRVGNDPDPRNNAECVGGIDRDGIFECATPLKGNYVGLVRTG